MQNNLDPEALEEMKGQHGKVAKLQNAGTGEDVKSRYALS
jgi:hypothetical protein